MRTHKDLANFFFGGRFCHICDPEGSQGAGDIADGKEIFQELLNEQRHDICGPHLDGTRGSLVKSGSGSEKLMESC